jgi:phosphoglycolate phosphatase-like HAD superfamily hydrolase
MYVDLGERAAFVTRLTSRILHRSCWRSSNSAHWGWMVGDTLDEARAARAGGVLPLGVLAPGASRDVLALALVAAGTVLTLDHLSDLLEVL